jgi:predicted transcriptional regulator
MEINISPEELKAIEGLAAQNGNSSAEQARQMLADAVQRNADYDRWFREKIREGRAASDRGEFIEHEEVGRMLNERFLR